MKAIPLIVAGVTASVFACQVSTGFAQGSLNPSGTPGAIMKSLDQIEARTPISALPYTISAAGSYYLTKNLSVTSGNAIVINSNNVTLDLNGFTISSTESPAANSFAIAINGAFSNVTVLNGNISSGVTYSGGTYSGSGFGFGVSYSGIVPLSAQVRGVNVTGVKVHGIYLGLGSTNVDGCTVNVAGGTGIYAASVSNSSALSCGTTAAVFANNAINCTGTGNGSANGVQAFAAHDCYGTSGTGAGISGNTANSCYGTSTSGVGVSVTTAINCIGVSNGSGRGVSASGAANCWGQSSGGNAIDAATAQNCVGTTTGTGHGVHANVAYNCYGTNNNTGFPSGDGVHTENAAIGCLGVANQGGTGNGVYSLHIADSCMGTGSTAATGNGGYGVYGADLVSNSSGTAYAGVDTNGPATTCFGLSGDYGVAGATLFNCKGSGNHPLTGHQYFCGTGSDPYP